MDEFERKYFAELKKLSQDFQSQRKELASSRIKMFAAALYRQLIDEKEKFELIVSSGNSGLYMMVIAKMVYKELNIKLPPTLTLPIFRFKDFDGKTELNDNSQLSGYVSEKINNLSQNLNILFVDDEIMTGITVKTSLELIVGSLPKLTKLRCVIISEHHFFEWHFNLPKVSVNYYAYSRLIQGLNGNISYFIPENLYSQITRHIQDVQSYNHVMAIVIGGGLKRKNNNKMSFYDTSVTNKLIKSISNYEQTRNTLLNEIDELVIQGIEEYKNKTIKFRF